MKSSAFTFKDQDGVEIFVYKWAPDAAARAAVQISHGLAEHAERYGRFAEALCKEGFVCYADDHRGHGRTAGDFAQAAVRERVGYLGPNGWNGTVNEIHHLSNIIRRENPDLPLFLFGHSWGSFMAQDYIQQWGKELSGCILCGTNGTIDKVSLWVGGWIAKKQLQKLDPYAPSDLMNKLSFGKYNNEWKKETGATGFEWLSRDKSEVKKYVDDPRCGFVAPASLWVEFFEAFARIWDPRNERRIPAGLPIYLIAGSRDPVGNRTKGIAALIKRYQKYGIKDLSSKFYEGARHEVLNETNREEVYRDVIAWLNAHLRSHD